jgi:hypothetical protein
MLEVWAFIDATRDPGADVTQLRSRKRVGVRYLQQSSPRREELEYQPTRAAACAPDRATRRDASAGPLYHPMPSLLCSVIEIGVAALRVIEWHFKDNYRLLS